MHTLTKTLLPIFLATIFPLSMLSQHGYEEVAYDDCGNLTKQPHLIYGENYTFPTKLDISQAEKTCNFGGKVIYAYDNMDINAKYRMEITFFVDETREIELVADGNPLCDNINIPEGKVIKKTIELPRHSYAYGQFVLVITVAKGPNAVVSEIRISSDNPEKLLAVKEESKEALKSVQAYKVDENVDAETVLPVYTPIPSKVSGVYSNKVSLDGIWQFSPSEAGKEWHPIKVPGEWLMQGFEVDSAAYCLYQRDFYVPEDWSENAIMLRFDGVHSEYEVSINGHTAGYHLGGMTPYEINISDYIIPGNNNVRVKVRSESKADLLGSLTQYAAHQLGGITRKVTLFAVPEVHVSDLRIITDLDEDYKDATLKLYVTVSNDSKQIAENLALNFTLDRHNAAGELKIPAIGPGEKWSGTIDIDVEEPLLWENEHPNLYILSTDLYGQNGSLAHITKKIGFREVEVQGNELLVNGVPVKLRGVCRHEAHPLYGRSLTDAEWKKDAELYREGNCNFIRTSHYPPAEEFIEYCDELGLFVELEAPVCWVGHHANENWRTLNYRDKQYYDYVLQADMETVHFYRNHPSVLFWSMANESYWNEHFAQVAEYMKKADYTRPFTFHDQSYGGFNNQGSSAPIANIHYPGPGGYKVAAKSDRPMTYGEYCHLNVYNRSELVTDPGIRSDWALALYPMWENMYATKGVLGGSIWSGIDDIFQLPNGDAVGYGAWGPIDGWRRPKPEYWDMKKTFSPVKVLTKSIDPNKELVIEVENRHSYTNLNELTVKWKCGDSEGICQADVAPRQTGKIIIPGTDFTDGTQLQLEFISPQGYSIDSYLLPVGEQYQNYASQSIKQKTKLKETKKAILVEGKGFKCSINRQNGQIEYVDKNGQRTLTGGPWLMVLPLTGGGCYPNHNAKTPIFNDCCEGWALTNIMAETKDNDVLIHIEGDYKDFKGGYTYTINSGGEITVDYDFESLVDVNPRQWGLVFETPEGYDNVFWRRDGLWSVYPQDHISRPIGEAKSFYPEAMNQNPRVNPLWPWSKDYNELGSNDFRSTRRNIWYAGLKNADNSHKITVKSDGQQHWRCWKQGPNTDFLIADFVTAGDEMFLGGHYAPYRKPLKKGDHVKGQIVLEL